MIVDYVFDTKEDGLAEFSLTFPLAEETEIFHIINYAYNHIRRVYPLATMVSFISQG